MSSEKSKILEIAQQYSLRGQIQKAIEEWKKLLTDTPNDANIYNTIGDLFLKDQTISNATGEAVSHYIKASEIFETSGFALKAIAVYKKILKIDQNRKDIYLRLGDLNCERGLIGNAREDYLLAAKLYSQEGLIREALDVYRKIADLDPSNLVVRIKIAEIFLKEGLKQEAIDEYNKVAVAQIKSGRREEAENIYTLILRVEPDNVGAIVEVGKIHLENGHIDEAIGYGKKAFEISPDSIEPLSLLIDTYNEAKMYDAAEELLTKYIESNPAQLSYRETLAAILLNKGDTDHAVDEYLALSREYFNQQDIEKAHMYAEKAVDISPDTMAAHELLFEIYSNRGRREEISDKGLFLARHFHETGDLDKSKEYYLKTLSEDPGNTEAKDGLIKIDFAETPEIEVSDTLTESEDITGQLASAEIYVKYGLIEKAISELQGVIEIEPYNEVAHIRLKDIYKSESDSEKALDECLILLRLYESSDKREKIDALIQEAMEINPADTRIKEYKDRLSISGRIDIDEMLEEARFYVQQGMQEEAVKVYEKILIIEPDNEEARSQFSELEKEKPQDTVPELEVIQTVEESSASFFDLGEALKEEVVVEYPKEPEQAEEPLAQSFEELFQEFHEGVTAQLSSEDYETHYDLGIAYKEMGLFQEAIGEFTLCVPDTSRFLDASSMAAMCHRELAEYSQAIEVLESAVASQQYSDQNHLTIKYELGILLEIVGRKEDALSVFNDIHETDSTYRDVTKKVLNLQKGE